MSSSAPVDAKGDELLGKKLFPSPSLIGKLLYCSNCTRPDITAAVNHLSRFMSAPKVQHLQQVKRLLRYLNGTSTFCLTFIGHVSRDVMMWQDSSYGDGENIRSRTGFVKMICGGLLVWGSRLPSTVALSSIEAEYMACCAAV